MNKTEITVDRFIAISPSTSFGGWYGAGGTVEEAKATLKAAGGTLNRVVVYRLPEGVHGAHADPFGGVRWQWVSDEFRTLWRDSGQDQLEVAHRRGLA